MVNNHSLGLPDGSKGLASASAFWRYLMSYLYLLPVISYGLPEGGNY